MKQSASAKSLGRTNKLNLRHAGEDPLFVQIVDGTSPKTVAIQSTVRARSTSSGTSPPAYNAALGVPRPQSPFAIVNSPSQSSLSFRPPSRIEPRRCYSAIDTEQIKPSPSSAKALAQVAAAPDQSYYAVGRGCKKAICTSKEDAERQVRNVGTDHQKAPARLIQSLTTCAPLHIHAVPWSFASDLP